MTYFVLRPSEDGDMSVEMLDAATLEKRIADGYYGDGERAPKWAACIPELDPNYWRGQAVIIKGEIVQPIAEQVVTRVRLP